MSPDLTDAELQARNMKLSVHEAPFARGLHQYWQMAARVTIQILSQLVLR